MLRDAGLVADRSGPAARARTRAVALGAFVLVLAPLAGGYFLHAAATLEFALAVTALVPLAWMIGEATEHVAEHVGHGLGGFLNASFGNVPEIIIALIAVDRGLPDVVRGTIAGSVVSNTLLVLGSALALGRPAGLDRRSLLEQLGLVGLAVPLLLIPSTIGFSIGRNTRELAWITLPFALVLASTYVAATLAKLSRQHREHRIGGHSVVEGTWPLPVALSLLAAVTGVTALVSDLLVGSLQQFGRSAHLSELFIAAVIVAVAGNAAEHGGAVIVARRGKMELATEIAISSAAQVALLVSAVVALLSWQLIPFAFGFRPVELATIGGAVAMATAAVADGRASRWRGLFLVLAYVGAATWYLLAG